MRQLAPGELWELGPRTTTHRWFAPSERLHATRTLDAAARAVDKALTVAVESALPARDGGARPVGAFLSGGLDSAVVLARVHESGTPVVAFTLSFGDPPAGRDALRGARSRGHLGVKHDVLSLDARRFCDGIPSAVEHLEDVVSETIAVPNFLLARQASQSVDVLFTGEGGDQSFGGPKNVGMALAYAYGGHRATPSLAHTYLSLYGYCWDDLADALQPDTLAAFDSDRMERDVGRRFFGERVPRDGSFVGRVMIGKHRHQRRPLHPGQGREDDRVRARSVASVRPCTIARSSSLRSRFRPVRNSMGPTKNWCSGEPRCDRCPSGSSTDPSAE